MKNIFSIINRRYILILTALSLLPVLLWLHIPNNWYPTPISTPSSANLDTKENNKFQIIFQVSPAPAPNSHLYVDAYLFKDYLFLNHKITLVQFTRKFLMDESGKILIPDLEAGKYLFWPQSIPVRLKLLNQLWILDIKDHNPDPLTIHL